MEDKPNSSTAWSVLCSATVDTAFSLEEVPVVFLKLIGIWRDQPHTVNRRLAGAMRDLKPDLVNQVLAIARELHGNLLPTFHETGEDVQVRRLISKSDLFSSLCFEISIVHDSKQHCQLASFFPVLLDELRNPHITIPYRIRLVTEENERLTLTVETEPNGDVPMGNWLKRTAHPTLVRWLKNMQLNHDSTNSIRLVDLERYAATYRRIKTTHGKQLAENWPERTSAEKFVYEDCAIAAYLVELWRDMCEGPQTFVDIGCGNGLLVYLLQLEGHKGIGLDLRKRNIWDMFGSDFDLREMSVDPNSGGLSSIPRQDWLIGNHSDELTPWIPVMAAKSASNFFVLPCCPFDFYGKFTKGRKSADGTNHFQSYLSYVRAICEDLGFDVREDRLKIPSTKRACFIGTIPNCGLPANISEQIALLTGAKDAPSFVARPKIEVVRNCTQLPSDFRHALTLKIFNILLENDSTSAEKVPESEAIENTDSGTEMNPKSRTDTESGAICCPESKTSTDVESMTTTSDTFTWRNGGHMSLSDCAALLSDDEKQRLRAQCGGLQTFLRNQHQVFCVDTADVSIRDWKTFGPTKSGEKRSLCWFHANHPDGCPLSDNVCTYLHSQRTP